MKDNNTADSCLSSNDYGFEFSRCSSNLTNTGFLAANVTLGGNMINSNLIYVLQVKNSGKCLSFNQTLASFFTCAATSSQALNDGQALLLLDVPVLKSAISNCLSAPSITNCKPLIPVHTVLSSLAVARF
jgi:hypothetical protein